MNEGADSQLLIGGIAALLAIASGALIVYLYFVSRRQPNLRTLMAGGGQTTAGVNYRDRRTALQNDADGSEYERLKKERKHLKRRKPKLSLDEKFFQAGYFTDKEKADYKRVQVIPPLIIMPLAIYFSLGFSIELMLGAILVAAGVSYQIPISVLDHKIKARHEEIMFFLPLVIEQIAIGVSSSLDIGPCLQRVVSMADERDSHNVVTELIRHAQFFVKSGVSLEDAMVEVGKASGHNELKHAFMSLTQVAKHGGEISRQLQDLADAVSTQREGKIEEKIKKLELEATAPVALVFVGFMVILLMGFGLQLMKIF